ncbi:hypothetical protein [Pararobbsia silviterrae]|uniref:hypothetical protein n=1 Tax=Pararobbsia silviterrae TaxID=1792498 RepID=UPI0011C44CC2|nr:hypothetical protein [Pararobbsia silviterrae]
MRERLTVGLENEVARKTLRPKEGVIEVKTAPPAFEETPWPLVTVHVLNDGSAERGVGEFLDTDVQDLITNEWLETQGWIARVQISVVGWSKNADERIAMRQALRRLVIGNLPVFQGYGMTRIDFSQTDADEMAAYPVPVYQTVGTFSCFAPAEVVTSSSNVVTDIDSSAFTPDFPDRSARAAF